MEIFQVQRGEYEITTDKSRLDFDVIHGFLSQSYWSSGIPMDTVKKAAQHAVTFGIFHEKQQVGYARVITDCTTFGYLADVFVVENERGKGLSKWLVETILDAPFLQGLRRWMLATRDAHGLYQQYGFTLLENPDFFMQINHPDIYNTGKNN
jgi:GNAT superfamily N-acetyltransferase